MEKKNVPELRFPEFTEPWGLYKLGEMADYKKGPFGSALKKDIFVPKDVDTVKIYEQQNAIKKDWRLARYFITKEYAHKLSGFEVHGGDIIVSCAGTIGEIYELPVNCEPGIINQALMRIRVNEKLVDKQFYKIIFSNVIDDFSRSRSNGSAIKNIPPFADLKALSVMIPSMKEQKELGAFFENIDHIIVLYQRKVDLLQKFKQGVLQQMFPREGEQAPRMRFPGFTRPWKQCKLTDLLKDKPGAMKIGPFGSALKKEYYVENGIKVYAQENIFNNDFNIGNYYITDEKFQELQTCELCPGDVVISMMGTIGACAVFPDNAEKGIMNSHLLRLQFGESVTSQFAMVLLKDAPLIREEMKRLSVGSIMTGLSASVVKKLVLPVPSVGEQKKISAYISAIDALIVNFQSKLNLLEQLKNGLLKRMLA